MFFAEKFLQDPRRRSVCKALRGYSYPDVKEGKAVVQEPHKDGVTDHACDCLRYLAINFFPILRLQTRVRQYA